MDGLLKLQDRCAGSTVKNVGNSAKKKSVEGFVLMVIEVKYELKETIEVVGRKINFSKTLELAIVQVIESSSQNSNMWKIKYR